MVSRDPEQLKKYLALITGKQGGIEAVIDRLPPETAEGGGFESFPVPRSAEALRGGMEAAARDRPLSESEMFGLEAIINAEIRPAVDIVDGKFQVTHPLWTHLSTDAGIRGRLEDTIPSVGRIELPGDARYPYGGTGFLVGERLLMTNRHVAAIFARGLGQSSLGFKTNSSAGIDFLRERNRPDELMFDVGRIVMIHPYWDMALLELKNAPGGLKPLTLSLADVSDLDGHEIAVIGYPAFDPRNDVGEQDSLFDRRYGIKRLQPGQLHGRDKTESFGKMVAAATHDCSTLGGNSGSCVVDLTTGEILALHFGGRYHDKNYGVPCFELARDGRVVDSGVNFAGNPSGGVPPWSDWWDKAGLSAIGEEDTAPSGPDVQAPSPAEPNTSHTVTVTNQGITFEIPLQITVRLGNPAAAGHAEAVEAVVPAAEDITEKMVEPWRDTDYESRKGYDKDFLGVEIPMPSPADPGVLAKTHDGKDCLHYQNFSIAMHAARRLAMITASNVTADPRLKKPDPTRKYTRRALSGLGPNDQERWFIDPRLDERFQLPDVFLTRDRGAFDKGHIVRRDDVAWGTTYEELRRGNGDSYHVTNCSPQTADYNRSALGENNWGDLENHVLSSAVSESLVQFAGPVLDPADEVFLGAGGGRNRIRAKIPSRFWKVIVTKTMDGIAAFGFVLEQDLDAVEFEFVVPASFVPHMYPITDVETMTGVRFPAEVREADQYHTERGVEVAIHSGAHRRAGGH